MGNSGMGKGLRQKFSGPQGGEVGVVSAKIRSHKADIGPGAAKCRLWGHLEAQTGSKRGSDGFWRQNTAQNGVGNYEIREKREK